MKRSVVTVDNKKHFIQLMVELFVTLASKKNKKFTRKSTSKTNRTFQENWNHIAMIIIAS